MGTYLPTSFVLHVKNKIFDKGHKLLVAQIPY